MPAPIDTIRQGLYKRSSKRSSVGDEEAIADIDRWITRDYNRWSLRNTRFQRDQEMYMLVKPGEWNNWVRRESDVLILPDPRTLVKKVARIMARHPNNIEITPSQPELRSTAQRMENFLYGLDQQINHHWMSGLNNPYRYDQSFYITLRGWLTERTLLRPDYQSRDSMDASRFFSHQIFDPANVYPFAASGETRRVNHFYRTTVEELLDDPLAYDNDNEFLKDAEPTAMVTIKACYWKAADGGWYHACLANNDWLKKPTEIGYNPWTIVLANGVPYRATDWDDLGYQDQIGVGILDDSVDNQNNLNRIASKLNALLSLEANPPVTAFTTTGKPQKIDFFPGSRMFLTQKDRVEVHRIGPQQGDYQLLWEILRDRAAKSGFPDVFWGQNIQEGLATTIALSSGKDVLWPFSEALNQADQEKYMKIFEMYRDFGPAEPLQARVLSPLGIGQISEITAADIAQQGTLVEVDREDMTPQELMAKLNLGMALVKGQALPMRDFRGKGWLGLKNPDAANLQVLSEQVYMSPDVIKALIPVALSDTGNQMLGAIWSMVQSGMPAPGSPASPNGQPGGMSGAPGGGPGQPGGASPNSPSAGLPTQALTPGMAGNPAATQNVGPEGQMVNPIAQMLTGGAVGGAGGGGMPPDQALLSALARYQGQGMLG
jgi:hypothetical protein